MENVTIKKNLVIEFNWSDVHFNLSKTNERSRVIIVHWAKLNEKQQHTQKLSCACDFRSFFSTFLIDFDFIENQFRWLIYIFLRIQIQIKKISKWKWRRSYRFWRGYSKETFLITMPVSEKPNKKTINSNQATTIESIQQ